MPLRHFLKRLQFQQYADTSNEYLFDVINLLAEGIIVCDPKGTVIFCNKKAPKILHRAESHILNQEVTTLFKKTYVPKTKFYVESSTPVLTSQSLGELLTTQVMQQRRTIIEQDVVYEARKQAHILAFNIRPVFDDDDELEVVIISFRDVTKRREHQENQVRFARIMGHELKHPLASIKAYVHFLRRLTAANNERAQSYLDKTDQQVNMLVKMINDLLDISKISANRLMVDLQIKDVTQIVADTVNDLRPVHRSNILAFKGDEPLFSLVDELRLRQVITNLISNAVKYSTPNDTIEIEVSASRTHAVIRVSDKGPGIDEDKLNRIFEPYIRVVSKDTRHVKGLGLGLYISKNIIDKHAGTIYAKNNKKKGSSFFVELPLVRG